MITIQATLDLGEAEDLFGLVHHQIVHNLIEQKLALLAGGDNP
jgi:hypothetical protein